MVFDLHAHLGASFAKGSAAYAAGDGAREYQRQFGVLKNLLPTTSAFFATRASDLLRAQRESKVAAFLTCEGGEFLDGNIDVVGISHVNPRSVAGYCGFAAW